jgi:hypothetical protein
VPINRLPEGATFDFESLCHAFIFDKIHRSASNMRWIARQGDLYTILRAEVELFEIAAVEERRVGIRCVFSETMIEPLHGDGIDWWDVAPADFAYVDFGTERAFVPSWALGLPDDGSASRFLEDFNTWKASN